MVNRSVGHVLLELIAVFVIVAFVALSSAASIRSQAANVRALYEERVAEEAAAAQMEVQEARGWMGLAEGRTVVPVETPGWENLSDAECAWTLSPAAIGGRIAVVEISWKGYRDGRRRVEMRTRIGGTQ